MGKALDTFVEVWHETFPNQKSEARNKMEERKKRTKMVREMEEKQASMTPEELEAYEQSIPEWKRGALTITEESLQEE